jgi:hypothetical protein
MLPQRFKVEFTLLHFHYSFAFFFGCIACKVLKLKCEHVSWLWSARFFALFLCAIIFLLFFHLFLSSLLFFIAISLLHSHIVAGLFSSCCCSITLLLVHGYSMLFVYGFFLALLFVCGYSLALLLVCHWVVIGPSSHNYWSYVITPSHSYYHYVVILSTSSTMPNLVPIRFVIVVPLCYCCSMCLVNNPRPPSNNLLVQLSYGVWNSTKKLLQALIANTKKAFFFFFKFFFPFWCCFFFFFRLFCNILM